MDDVSAMSMAIAQARRASANGDVPIGCVILHSPTNKIVGLGYNRREKDSDPTAHAEIVAIRQAGQTLGSWRLLNCTVFVTLEPCPMCAGAMVNARVERLVYGCPDPKAGAVDTLFQLCRDSRLNHSVATTAGMLAEQCGNLLKDFFKQQRALGKK